MTKKRWYQIDNLCKTFSCFILILLVVFSPVIYLAILNMLGPSTEYHNPSIGTVVRVNGQDVVYLGDEFYVNIFVVRHRLNGNCHFKIRRYAEPLDNDDVPNKRFLISASELQFVGQNEMRRTRWPNPPDKYILGYAVNEKNEPQYNQPLLPDGVDQQEFLFYVVGRYYCNFLDYIFPRYIQGGPREDETAHVRALLKRHKP